MCIRDRKKAGNSAAKRKVEKGSTNSDGEDRLGSGGERHQIAGGNHPVLTTNQGNPISDNQNSLRSNSSGPTLLEDVVLREKITHFDHERIPERIVHARGTAAHGYFELTESLAHYSTCLLYTSCGTSCILIGYFLGTMWMLFEAWLGPTLPYLILAGVALIILGVIFRHSLLEILAPRFTKRRQSL